MVDATTEGYIAAFQGLCEEDNPYMDGTKSYAQWMCGFWKGKEAGYVEDYRIVI